MDNVKPAFTFHLKMLGQESKVRGIYLSVACDFENLMSDIIAMCEETDEEKIKDNRLMQPLMIGAKLEKCKELVELHNKEYYDFFLPEFDIIDTLCKYRNMLAHSFAEYDPNKLDDSYIIFKWVKKSEDKTRKLISEKIFHYQFIMQIKKYRKNIFKFMTLHAAIARDKGFYLT